VWQRCLFVFKGQCCQATTRTRRARRLMPSPPNWIAPLHYRVRGTYRWCRSDKAWCDDSFAVPGLCIQTDVRGFVGFQGDSVGPLDRFLHPLAGLTGIPRVAPTVGP
jgi:hypothetical protein